MAAYGVSSSLSLPARFLAGQHAGRVVAAGSLQIRLFPSLF